MFPVSVFRFLLCGLALVTVDRLRVRGFDGASSRKVLSNLSLDVLAFSCRLLGWAAISSRPGAGLLFAFSITLESEKVLLAASVTSLAPPLGSDCVTARLMGAFGVVAALVSFGSTGLVESYILVVPRFRSVGQQIPMVKIFSSLVFAYWPNSFL